MPTRGTSTRSFGSGKREGHDATAFYSRFSPPILSVDEKINPAPAAGPGGETLLVGDSRCMDLPDSCVALVVTSPPYFAGKAYEEALGQDGIPADYVEYLDLLRQVLGECVRVLEPGGRLAVNVANLGRRPYRSLAADVISILQDDLGLLLRGEIVWAKAEGASGSCAWGSFRSASNPVLRDVTERVIVASKGRFERAPAAGLREQRGLPSESWITSDEFMEATLDLWHLAPERARRVGHPAPFPVELPLRLIDLFTYRGDLVLDPFLGSGTTAVAAARRQRRWWGYDTDPAYVDIARRRVAEELSSDGGPAAERQRLAVESGQGVVAVAVAALEGAGFSQVRRNVKVAPAGAEMAVAARDGRGEQWYFDLSGTFATGSRGLAGSALWATLGRAAAVSGSGQGRVVLLTTTLPPPRSQGDRAIRTLGPAVVFDAIELFDPAGAERLGAYARGGCPEPGPGFWP
ncbi:MAG TPA: site-specific DNA-methyltransferase [Acidimicrobiales bacterium]|nr:site-specific DNA-methyltransferase [Acidimicrobiales bacterium]